jgi:xanthine/CO dehydrogenase XdhC/CoxF family maturation factor
VATKELQSIAEAHARARHEGRAAALVTVVRTSGSTYRRPGARMLVVADAHGGCSSVGADFLGSISGGCLEDDAREHAREAMRTGEARLVRYDTTAEGDILFGSGLGCQGVVEVLVEPLPDGTLDPDAGRPADPVGCIAWSLRQRRVSALASILAVEPAGSGVAPARAGEFLWLAEDCAPLIAVGHPEIAARVTEDARTALDAGRAADHEHTLANGTRFRVFVDVIVPPRSLLICGAGYDAIPLARLGKELGWRVRVVDGRKAYVVPERFPGVDELVHCPPPQFAARIPVERGEAVMLMTHNFLHDREVLRALLRSEAAYIGVLGPRKRTDRLLEELATEGVKDDPIFSRKSLRRLHGPAGLDIGAEAPEQIALAIIAEIEAVSARRRGGVLKRRKAPLHRR